MSEDLERLQRLLEQATAAEGTSADDRDPETVSLREAWIGFGRLLEAAQSPVGAAVQLPHQLDRLSPLPLGEGQGVRAMPRRLRVHRWLISAAALVAASLLIAILAVRGPRATDRAKSPSPAVPQTAAINAAGATLVHQEREAVKTAAEPQWDDSLDEQIAQVGRRMVYAQQEAYAGPDAYEPVRYGIEQMQQDLEGNGL